MWLCWSWRWASAQTPPSSASSIRWCCGLCRIPDADRLALIWETDLKDGIKREGPSGPNFLDWKEQSQSFDEMALLEVGTGTLTGEGEPEQVTGLRVTTNFLSMLGARTVLGRGFTAAEGAGQGALSGGRSHQRILEAPLRHRTRA